MSLFVYVTKRCEEEAASAGWQEDLEKLKNKVEQVQDLQGFDHFPAPYRVKKKFPRYNARLIASLHKVDDHDVACFLSILTKADSAYDQFQNDPVGFGQHYFEGLFTDVDLQQIVTERTAKTPPESKPQPTEAEYSFLFRAGGGAKLGSKEDGLICETPAWVAKVTESPVKDRLTEFHKVLENLTPEKNFVPIPGRPGWGIFYVRHPQLRMTVLLEPLTGDADKQLPHLVKKYAHLMGQNGVVTEDKLLRNCQRAYPDYLCYGEDEWLEVQKDAVANIALSPEETKVLEAARQTTGAFPLFINGRAGSGKSTLLQYIFAEHLYLYLTQEQDASFKPPLYLTCSPELLQHSRSIVEKLLKCNASFLSASESLRTVSSHRSTLDLAFQEFRPFLLSHLPAKDRIQDFHPNNRVDYAKFRKLWQQKFGNDIEARKRFGPDISWHVIRTYIKGMSAESRQDPDDYRQFDAKERQVTDEAFRLVHERVWNSWYRPTCEDLKLWDDQDLACRLIQGNLVKPELPAIFCDEAQDFTRLELEIILRLCLFSNRTISPQQISSIPLVFAGDPFQTLNPTGFRWEATKAAFVEKFVLSLDPNRRSGMDDLQYRELTYNYRSSRRIVLFSNLVQALRCRLFDLRRVNPQEPWASETASAPVVWFDANDAKFWERLRKEPGVTLIVPCGEGEEQEYVQQHPVLRQWIRFDQNGVPLDLNVFSSGRAKGLEFDRVAVFGFGDYIQEDVLATISGNATPLDSDKSLPLEYFINRLYVAVSRPKRRLFIVDGKSGRERLWKFATDSTIQERIIQCVHDGQGWEGKIEGMVEGLLEHFDTVESTDFEEEAKNLKAQGLSQNDSYLLRSAANRYRLAGLQGEANYCLAEALFADGKFLDAGKAFTDCSQYIRTVDSYWRAGRAGDKPLLQVSAARPELQNRLECELASFLTSPRDFETGNQALTNLAEHAGNVEEAVVFTSCSYWTEPARRVAEKLVELGEKQPNAPDWNALSTLFERLESAGFGLKITLRARVCFLAEEWPKAVMLWESANDKTSTEYREAKARVAPYPEKLGVLKELGKDDAILDAYKSNHGIQLDAESKRIVAMALVSAKRFDEALELLVNAGAIAELSDLAVATLAIDSKGIASKAIRLCALLSVEQSQWTAIREYLNNGQLPRASKASQKALAPLLKELKWDFDCLLTVGFARSDSITKLDGGEQKPFSKFLRHLDRNCDWHSRISVEELGAAIERSQHYLDAVEFYESLMTSTKEDKQKHFAIIRWVKSKQRLEAFYQGEKQYRKAEDTKLEWEKVKSTHQFQDAELAVEYPELDTLNELIQRELRKPAYLATNFPSTQNTKPKSILLPLRPTPPQPASSKPPHHPKPDTEIMLGQIKLKISRENQRINIEHQATSKTATIRFSPIRCTSEDITWKAESSESRQRCEEWGLFVDFSRLETGRLIILNLESAGVEVSLKVDG